MVRKNIGCQKKDSSFIIPVDWFRFIRLKQTNLPEYSLRLNRINSAQSLHIVYAPLEESCEWKFYCDDIGRPRHCVYVHSMYYSGRKMSSPSDDADESMHDPLADELRNIESVIIVTRRNIDALNEKFANLQEPPAMYIIEYQELTQKLHELETKKCELTERVRQSESPEPAEENPEVSIFVETLD